MDTFNLIGGKPLSVSFSIPAPSTENQVLVNGDYIVNSKSKHTIRTGFEIERTQWNLVFGGLGQGWMFMGSFSNLLAGDTPGNLLFCRSCVRSRADGIIHAYRLPNMNAFTQDDWKVSSKLTVNLGVRWEYNGTLSDKNGNLTNTSRGAARQAMDFEQCRLLSVRWGLPLIRALRT